MKHLILCREYPPAPGGGIGAYASQISRLLAANGETVHVISQTWEGAEAAVQEAYSGRLVVHRIPIEDWRAIFPPRPHPSLAKDIELPLFQSGFYPQCFAWKAGLLAERLIEEEGIDLVEAQEYEAPLYYWMLRRALGVGPVRQPPALVHLHSPTQFIARHNDWEAHSPWVQTAKRLEDYCIAAADALLCPSHTFARQAEAHYGLEAGQIQVIPLPLGESDCLERAPETWTNGTILYVGRLERRKGVLEWIQAAASVAHTEPAARFEFAGANILGNNRIESQAILDESVPSGLKRRFLFRGEQPHAAIPSFLRRARLAVVPSRWENFPYSCMEAMASGLPVLATRQGGMVEMIEDGRTGWLVAEPGVQGLAAALRRALDTPASTLAEMGSQASQAIRQLCDDEEILARHLELRLRIAANPPCRSIHIPANLPRAEQSFAQTPPRRAPQKSRAQGLAVVISASNNASWLHASLGSIASQTQKPLAVLLVLREKAMQPAEAASLAKELGPEPLLVISPIVVNESTARLAGWQAIRDGGIQPSGLVFLEAGQVLAPEAVAACQAALQHCPEAGLVSFWTQVSAQDYNLRITPCPAFPYQQQADEVSPASAVRFEALEEAIQPGTGAWGLSNAILEKGWVAVTLPQVLLIEPAGKRLPAPAGKLSRGNDPWRRRLDLGLVLRHPFSTIKTAWSLLGEVAVKSNPRPELSAGSEAPGGSQR